MNVKMVQNAFHLVLSMNANAKIMAILENIVKTVNFIKAIEINFNKLRVSIIVNYSKDKGY
jgi:hypothetical protein